MPTLAWIILWSAVVVVLTVLVVRERRAGKRLSDYDADALRGPGDSEARIRRSVNGPNIGGNSPLG